MGWALFFGGDCILKRWVTVLRTRKYKIRSNDKKNNISHVISSVECFSCSKFLTLYRCVKIGHLRIIPTNGDKTWSSLASASTTLTVVGVYKVVEPLKQGKAAIALTEMINNPEGVVSLFIRRIPAIINRRIKKKPKNMDIF